MSCLSLAQLMMGGGTLWTSHGKTASSPSITDIFVGPAECSSSPALDLGRTGRSNTQTFNSSLLAFRHVDMVKLTCWGSNWASHEEERRFKRLWMWVICWYHLLEFAQNVDLVKNDQCDPRNLNLAIISWRKMLHLAPVLLYRLCVAFSWWWGLP